MPRSRRVWVRFAGFIKRQPAAFVTVNATKKQLGDKRYMVSFRIQEGPQVYARSISIAGNRRLTDQHIFDEMETKGVAPDGVVNALTKSAGVVQDERLINDLNRIRNLYRKHGMPGIKFRCANAKNIASRVDDLSSAKRTNQGRRRSKIDPVCFADDSIFGATIHSHIDVFRSFRMRTHALFGFT